ncbi:MAG: hypothetical protein JWQ09_495 [Segetibacter sp.]|nr:hypothetical protein [Segetibacter sp.]
MKESFQQSPDPSKSSIREEALNLRNKGINEFEDDTTKEKFHYLYIHSKTNYDPQKERFVSLLLKGIVNTADVVIDSSGKLLSHKQKLENLSSNKENLFEELEADNLIFYSILYDSDRYAYKSKGLSKFKNLISKDKWQEDKKNSHNIAINTKEDKAYHYDFGSSLFYYYSVYDKNRQGYFKNYVLSHLEISEQKVKNSKKFLDILSDKLNKLYDQCFADEEHSFFNAVVKRSSMSKSNSLTELGVTKNLSDEDKVSFLYKEMKRRTEIVRNIVQERIKIIYSIL